MGQDYKLMASLKRKYKWRKVHVNLKMVIVKPVECNLMEYNLDDVNEQLQEYI